MRIVNVKSGDHRHRCLNDCSLCNFINDDVSVVNVEGSCDFVDDVSHGVDFVLENQILPSSAYRLGPEATSTFSNLPENEFEHCCSFSSTGERIAYFFSSKSRVPNVTFLDGGRLCVLITKFLWQICKNLHDHIRIKIGVAQDCVSNYSSTEFLKILSGVSIVKMTGNISETRSALKRFSIGVYFTVDGNGSVYFQKSLISELLQIESSLENNTDLRALNTLHSCRILLGLARLFSLSPPTGDALINLLACEFIFCFDNTNLIELNQTFHNQAHYKFDWHPEQNLPDELINCDGIKEINEIMEEAFDVKLGDEDRESSNELTMIRQTLLSGMCKCPLQTPIHGFTESELESLNKLDAYADPTTMFCSDKVSINFDNLSKCWSPIFRFIHVQRFRNMLKILLNDLPTDAISRLVICPHSIEANLVTIYVEADSVQRAENVVWCIILMMRAHVLESPNSNEYLTKEGFFRSELFKTEFYDIADYNTRKTGVKYIKCYDESKQNGDMPILGDDGGNLPLIDACREQSTATERVVPNPLYIYSPLLRLENTIFAQPTLTLPTVLSPECLVSTVHYSVCDSNISTGEFLRSASLSKRKRYIDQRFLQRAYRRMTLSRSKRKSNSQKFRDPTLRSLIYHIKREFKARTKDTITVKTRSGNLVADDVDMGEQVNSQSIPEQNKITPIDGSQMNGFASAEEKQRAIEYNQLSHQRQNTHSGHQNINGDLQINGCINHLSAVDNEAISGNDQHVQEFRGTTTDRYEATSEGSCVQKPSTLYDHSGFNHADNLDRDVMGHLYPKRAGFTTDLYCKVMGKFPYFAINPVKQSQTDNCGENASPVMHQPGSQNIGEWFPFPPYPHHSTLGYMDTSNGEDTQDVNEEGSSASWEELGFTRISHPDIGYTHFKVDDCPASMSQIGIGTCEMVNSLPNCNSDSDEPVDQNEQASEPASPS